MILIDRISVQNACLLTAEKSWENCGMSKVSFFCILAATAIIIYRNLSCCEHTVELAVRRMSKFLRSRRRLRRKAAGQELCGGLALPADPTECSSSTASSVSVHSTQSVPVYDVPLQPVPSHTSLESSCTMSKTDSNSSSIAICNATLESLFSSTSALPVGTSRSHMKRLDVQVRFLLRKREALLESIKGLKREVIFEREARFVVEKCFAERLRKMELEVSWF